VSGTYIGYVIYETDLFPVVPYFPADLMKNAQKRIYGFEGFSKEDMKAIRHGNALKIFPTILDRIQDTSCQTIFEEA
jgi:hypothetical protein